MQLAVLSALVGQADVLHSLATVGSEAAQLVLLGCHTESCNKELLWRGSCKAC